MTSKTSSKAPLSISQIDVLLEGHDHKLSRSSMGWSFDDGMSPVRLYRPATIKSLWERGLLDANFVDPRGVGRCLEACGVENLDGARHAHTPEVPELFVWTSALGRKVLGDQGILSEKVGNVYH